MSLLTTKPRKPPRPDYTDFAWLMAGVGLGGLFCIGVWILARWG
jgi:hypothetical protein